MSHRVFNPDEVAEYLHLSRAAIEQLVQRKEIPFSRQGQRLVFRQREIDAWASRRILGFSEKELSAYHKTSSTRAHDLSAKHALLPELVRASHIDPALKAKTKNSVIRTMVKLAEQTDLLNAPEELLEGILEREQMCSTALTGGIALLHTKNHEPYMAEDCFIALGRTLQPIPFGSPDGQTTDIFFLLCAQDDRTHLHILARLCMMCHHTDLLTNLRDCINAHGMLQALYAAEAEIIARL